jgi:hypothetical protein
MGWVGALAAGAARWRAGPRRGWLRGRVGSWLVRGGWWRGWAKGLMVGRALAGCLGLAVWGLLFGAGCLGLGMVWRPGRARCRAGPRWGWVRGREEVGCSGWSGEGLDGGPGFGWLFGAGCLGLGMVWRPGRARAPCLAAVGLVAGAGGSWLLGVVGRRAQGVGAGMLDGGPGSGWLFGAGWLGVAGRGGWAGGVVGRRA